MKIDMAFVSNKTCQDISLAILCDQQWITNIKADAMPQSFCIDVSETPGDHILQITMTGKTASHTVVSNDGEITDDVYVTLCRLDFEGLDMREIFCQGRTCYSHDFNGSQPAILDEFYGIIGCNGTVRLAFSLPLFLWLGDYLD